MTTTPVDHWHIRRLPGFSLSHPWISIAPGCPDARHPHRWCACKVHRTKADAEYYVLTQETQPSPEPDFPRGTLPEHGIHQSRWSTYKQQQWNERTTP